MKLPDVNLLLYAVDQNSPRHKAAHSWLEQTLSGTETVGFCWSVLLAFVRLTTNPVVFEHPLTSSEAIEYLKDWLAQPCVTIIDPTVHHLSGLKDLLNPIGSAGNLVTDAHLAALAIEHGAELHSCDADFSRFPGLQWKDPLRN